MITEDFVSFETAKLLKEKGFDAEGVSEFGGFYIDYYHTGKSVGIATESMVLNKDLNHWEYLRPTLQMAMKWLREKEIFIAICHCTYPRERKVTWLPEISTFDSVFPDSAIEYDTYEEACEEAIKYCLENLI